MTTNKSQVQGLDREYNYILARQEFPQEGGYRMVPEALPDWMKIKITSTGESKRLTVHSRIHVSKESQVGPSYSTEFTDQEIIKDLSAEIYRRFIK